MKINSLSFKNILSYGNSLTTIDFDNSIVGITGFNGHGKSTILVALYFALTGKQLRKINKGELINNTNKKGCYVELNFTNKNNNFTVKRGIKPDLFEIYKNNELVPEDKHIKDYQLVLESITNLTPKIIEQILIISNKFYQPFFKLNASDKRKFTETIFGIDVIAEMSDNVKVRLSSVKEQELTVIKDLERVESNITLLNESHVKVIDVEIYKEDIKHYQDVINSHKLDIEVLISEIDKHLKVKGELELKLNEYKEYEKKHFKCELKLKELNKSINNLTDICQSCNQKIPNFNKKEKEKQLQGEIELWEGRINKLNSMLKKVELIKERFNTVTDNVSKLKEKKYKLELEINKLENDIINHKKQINNQLKVESDNENKIKQLKESKKQLTVTKVNVTNEKNNLVTLQKLLSEKGIRNYIFNKYLNILNNTSNYYLEIFNSNLRVKFDGEFNEVIYDGNSKISYGSLSSGESQRLDLALMFSFLEIAKTKNSVNCNLLAFDEMFSDLDEIGITGLNMIFNKIKREGGSVLLITHDDRIKSLTDKSYVAIKNRFSKLELE